MSECRGKGKGRCLKCRIEWMLIVGGPLLFWFSYHDLSPIKASEIGGPIDRIWMKGRWNRGEVALESIFGSFLRPGMLYQTKNQEW